MVQFLGTYLSKTNEEYMIFEYCSKGNLVNYLRENLNTLLTKDLLQIVAGVCSGMAFLEAKKVIHRDLSARNCLVSKYKN